MHFQKRKKRLYLEQSYNGPILDPICATKMHQNAKQKGKTEFKVRKMTVRALLALVTVPPHKYVLMLVALMSVKDSLPE